MRLPDRLLAVAMFAVVLGACSTPAGSGSPSPSGVPSPASSPTPASSGASGRRPEPSPTSTPEPATETPGSVGQFVECDEEGTRCEIHQTGDAGQESAGWPVAVDGPCPELRTGPDGLAYVGCTPPAGATIHVLGLDGQPVDGWPVQVPGRISSVAWNDFSIGCGTGLSAIELGSDGSVYVAISSGSAAKLHVFNPDGVERDGWPQAIPGDASGLDGWGGDGCRGFAVADDDGVVAWGYEDVEEAIELDARRTEFTSWSPDGQVRPGWPRGSTGAASGPVLDSDGGITYVSASGKVWSHDDRGEVRAGWPYVLDRTSPPFATPDGRVAIIQEIEQAADQVVLLGRDGHPTAGGPIELPADIETRCLFGDTPCAGIAAPTFADDGTMYLSLGSSAGDDLISEKGGMLIAFDVDGRVVDGWPVELPSRTHVLDLSVDNSDRVVARGVACGPECTSEVLVSTVLVFAADGTLLEQRNED